MVLKLKMSKTYNKLIPSHPDIFIENYTSNENIQAIFNSYTVTEYTYEGWQKVNVVCKSKSGAKKKQEKMKIVKQTKPKQEFEDQFLLQVLEFRQYTERIRNQLRMQRKLKEDLPEKHVYIHMDFAEDYRCHSQEEIQSAYWGQTQVTIHPVVQYFKRNSMVHHQSFVFISNEPRHNAKFVYALLRLLAPQLKELIQLLQYIHYWTNPPTSQYRNKTIFKIILCNSEYFKGYLRYKS